jgi:protein TonB
VPAGLAVSGPRWIEGFITDDDYPSEARRLGLQGSVLLAVFILADGSVRDVRVVKGTYEPLNQVALAKVRASRFTPATDGSGRAIPCKLMLPIRFELK